MVIVVTVVTGQLRQQLSLHLLHLLTLTVDLLDEEVQASHKGCVAPEASAQCFR